MDQENADISCKEVRSDKKMEVFGNPAYCGHMCSGTQSSVRWLRYSMVRGWLFPTRQFLFVPTLMEVNWMALGKPVSQNLSSFFMPHLRILHLMLACTESLPAFEAFLYYLSLCQNEIPYCYYVVNLWLWEAVSGISGIFQQVGREGGVGWKLGQHFPPWLPPLPSLLLDLLHFLRVTSFQPFLKVICWYDSY